MTQDEKPADILIVDDVAANLNVLSAMLTPQGYTVRPAISGELALKAAQKSPPDLILLDIRMKDMNGYQVCEALKADERLRDIPVIFISALNDIEDKLKAFQVGGVDYINKPFYIEEVIARVQTHLILLNQRREIARLREQDRQYYEELGKMKDQFVTVASHDLKSPLALVRGYTELLGDFDFVRNDPEAKSYVEWILRGIVNMQRLITNLLDLARIETGHDLRLGPVPLAKFLSDCLANCTLKANEKHITLSFTPPPADLIQVVDETKMAQVLDNLLSNALKYTPENGHVELSADIIEDQLVIRITDNGMGIPAAALPHLFERFYRVQYKDYMNNEGTGLGLSIVKAIVEQHGGKIWVESEEGSGSIFSITLPLRQAE